MVLGFIAPSYGCLVRTSQPRHTTSPPPSAREETGPRNCPPGQGMKDGVCQDLNTPKNPPPQCPPGTGMKDGVCQQLK